jgi:spermidine/putrescine-binding protein
MPKIMDVQEFRSRLANHDISRRQVHQVLASVGLATVMLPVVHRPSWAQEYETDPDLMVFTWSGYDIPEFAGSYIEKWGKMPSFALWGEEEEGFQKMRAGFRPDIAAPCTYSLRRWWDAGLIADLDVSRLEHWDEIFPSLKTVEGAQQEGQQIFLPIDWGNSSVLFRPDLAPEYSGLENNSWLILFDEKYAGRLGIYDSVDGVFGVVGAVIGAENPFDMTDEELAEATELLRKQREVLRWYWTDITAVEQGLATGELVASYAWNSSVLELKNQGVEIEYMVPKEGIYTWVCGNVHIATGEGSEEKVYDYLNAISAAETGVFEIENYGYGHCNMKAFEMVPQETLENLGISDPVAFMENSRYFSEIPPATREKYIALFDEIKAGF